MFTPTTLFPLQLHIRRKAVEPSNHQTQSLGYWCHFMTVFETTQEEIKILPPSFPTTDSWLQARALYKPLDSSRVGAAHSSWGASLLSSPLRQLRIKAPISPELCLHIFHLASADREGQDFSWQQSHHVGCSKRLLTAWKPAFLPADDPRASERTSRWKPQPFTI